MPKRRRLEHVPTLPVGAQQVVRDATLSPERRQEWPRRGLVGIVRREHGREEREHRDGDEQHRRRECEAVAQQAAPGPSGQRRGRRGAHVRDRRHRGRCTRGSRAA